MSTTPNSIPEHIAYEEQMERRQQAMARHGRQQAELFEDEHDYPECPTCGEHERPGVRPLVRPGYRLRCRGDRLRAVHAAGVLMLQ
jgi:hypothetical protein